MKQPELGKRISELRKVKGLTQEELVDKCNISVRTLQRIEAGEVTPRSYTIKTILAALDYDINSISEGDEEGKTGFVRYMRHLICFDKERNSDPAYVSKQLNVAWSFGIIYFILGFFEAAAEYFRFDKDQMIFGMTIYVVLKILVFISYFFFQRGFVFVGINFRNDLLKIMSYVLIAGMLLIEGYDIASAFYDSAEREFMLGAQAISFGIIGILYGYSILKLQDHLGNMARLAGIFEIIAAAFFLSVLLAFIGEIILIPAELAEIVILFRTAQALSPETGPVKA